MMPSPNPMQAGGPPPPSQMGQPAGGPPSLANAPGQKSALGGSPVGLGDSPDPMAILAKAQLLLKSGAISPQQFQMIVAKLGIGTGSKGATPVPTGPAGQMPGAPQGMPQPQGGPPPSPQWNQ